MLYSKYRTLSKFYFFFEMEVGNTGNIGNIGNGGEMYHQYLKYTRKYKSIYGEHVLVLMQVGQFFEIYSNKNDEVDIYKISLELDMKIGIKCGIYMTGFNCDRSTKEKHIKKLLDCGYTLVLVEQIGDGINHKERDVTEILSPGINTLDDNSNYLITVVAKEGELGITIIDISTGKSFLFEEKNNRDDPERALDQLCRIMLSFNPIEALIIDPDKHFGDNLMKIMKSTRCCAVYHYNNWDKMEYLDNLSNPIYQQETFLKIFNRVNVAPSIGIIEGSSVATSLCCSLQFVKDHNSRAITFLDLPVIQHNSSRYLNIHTDGAIQLNYISWEKRDNSVVKIINRCSTAFGKRTLYDRLINPLSDPDEIRYRYSQVEAYMEDNLWMTTLEHLKNITDIEKIHRKIVMDKASSSDWISLIECVNEIKKLYNILGKNTEYIQQIQDILTSLSIDNLSKINNIKDATVSLFEKGFCETMDQYVQQRCHSIQELENIAEMISAIGKTNDATLCRTDTSGDDHIITMTKKRYDKAVSINKTIMSEFTMKPSKKQGNVLLTNDNIDKNSKNIYLMEEKIKEKNTILYKDYLSSFVNNHIYDLINIVKDVAEIDINTCFARNTVEWNLTKPVLTYTSSSPSSLSIKGLRHPIIERTSTCVENDVSLGYDEHNGMLLYGINSSGKSSLMKAVGINILLAQSGSFVFAKEMTFEPYHNLMTRITGRDNIFRGLSTFEVEINELRNIILRADEHSLVLGDEVCSGTESVSAISIVCATLKKLVDKCSSFIFATHLHELVDISIIKELVPRYIFVGHLEINFENNKIIYNRTLKEGSGDPVYGIDVCRCLRMPLDFIKMACDVKKELINEEKMIISTRKSNYNSKVFMDKCFICGNRADDTHHINYQKDHDDQNKSKNFKGNLLPLCKRCHIDEHTNKIDITGTVKTNEGIIVAVNDKNSEVSDNIDKVISNDTQTKLIEMRDYIRYSKSDKWWIRKRRNGIFVEERSLDNLIQYIFKKIKVLLTLHDLQDDLIKKIFYDVDL